MTNRLGFRRPVASGRKVSNCRAPAMDRVRGRPRSSSVEAASGDNIVRSERRGLICLGADRSASATLQRRTDSRRLPAIKQNPQEIGGPGSLHITRRPPQLEIVRSAVWRPGYPPPPLHPRHGQRADARTQQEPCSVDVWQAMPLRDRKADRETDGIPGLSGQAPPPQPDRPRRSFRISALRRRPGTLLPNLFLPHGAGRRRGVAHALCLLLECLARRSDHRRAVAIGALLISLAGGADHRRLPPSCVSCFCAAVCAQDEAIASRPPIMTIEDNLKHVIVRSCIQGGWLSGDTCGPATPITWHHPLRWRLHIPIAF